MTTKLQKFQDEIKEATATHAKNLDAYINDDLEIEEAGMHMFNEGFLAGLIHAQRILLDARYN